MRVVCDLCRAIYVPGSVVVPLADRVAWMQYHAHRHELEATQPAAVLELLDDEEQRELEQRTISALELYEAREYAEGLRSGRSSGLRELAELVRGWASVSAAAGPEQSVRHRGLLRGHRGAVADVLEAIRRMEARGR